MENKEYLEKIKEVDDLKLFSMSEWVEAETSLQKENSWFIISIAIIFFVIGIGVGIAIQGSK